MGRVASKRKLKQCDPFFKGTRDNGKKPKAYDLPPVQSKRSKKRQRKALDEKAIEQFVLRSSEVTPQGSANGKKSNKKKLDAVGSIREGESMKEFNKRINTEVKRVIYEESKKTRRKSEKRKEYVDGSVLGMNGARMCITKLLVQVLGQEEGKGKAAQDDGPGAVRGAVPDDGLCGKGHL
jgi:hypothetical protein